MLKKYKAKKDIGFGLLLLVCPLISWFILLLHSNIFLLLLALIVTLFFLWIWFGTFYQLDDDVFIADLININPQIAID